MTANAKLGSKRRAGRTGWRKVRRCSRGAWRGRQRCRRGKQPRRLAACGLCLLPCSTEAHCSASAGALSAGGARRLRAAALRGGGCALLCLLGGLAAWGWKAARGGRDGVAGAPAGALKVGAPAGAGAGGARRVGRWIWQCSG